MRTFFIVPALFARAVTSWVANSPLVGDARAQDTVKKRVTQGRAKTIIDNLYKCPVKVGNYRIAGVGQITANDGTVITVPAETALQKGIELTGADLYTECNQITPAKTADVSTDKALVVEVDADGDGDGDGDGEIITGYIVADNYFELYMNGKLVAADNTPFTPFPQSGVRQPADRAQDRALTLRY